MSQDPSSTHHTRRDAETLLMIGAFLAILAVPVVIGTWWANTTAAAVVNVVFGLLLLALGVGAFARGWYLRRRCD